MLVGVGGQGAGNVGRRYSAGNTGCRCKCRAGYRLYIGRAVGNKYIVLRYINEILNYSTVRRGIIVRVLVRSAKSTV